MTRGWLLWVLLLALLGCAAETPRNTPRQAEIAAGHVPAADTDEAGLWMQMGVIEQRLQTSGRLQQAPELDAYLRGIICRLDPEHCGDIRFYVVVTPHFNASMAPNGYMEIWSGLLLRAENEAQLAYILGHELGHYLQRHSLQQWRNLRKTSDTMAFVGLATALAGVGYAGDLAQLAALGGMLAYSREHEREADDLGLALMVRAGYDPSQAPDTWRNLLAERTAADDPEGFIFFSTHPSSESRAATLEAQAAALAQGEDLRVGTQDYLRATRPYRGAWLANELEKDDYAASEVLLQRLLAAGDRPGELWFYQGELYRLRAGEGDQDRAIASYRKALSADGAPAQTYRSLGLMCWRNGQNQQARQAFVDYLAADDAADDRLIIESYIQQLQ